MASHLIFRGLFRKTIIGLRLLKKLEHCDDQEKDEVKLGDESGGAHSVPKPKKPAICAMVMNTMAQ